MACEVMATAGKILVAGEISVRELPDIPAIVCQTVRELSLIHIWHRGGRRKWLLCD